MRVLLPLRKVPANNHENNNCNTSQADEGEDNEQKQQPQKPIRQAEAEVGSLVDPICQQVGTLFFPEGLHSDSLRHVEATYIHDSWSRGGSEIDSSADAENEDQKLGAVQGYFSSSSRPIVEEEELEKKYWNNETGLRTSLVESLKDFSGGRKSSAFNRKRRAAVEAVAESAKACKKRPALDRKPPARDLSNMVGGSRRRPYPYSGSCDDSLRQSSTDDSEDDPLENNPASARGDPLNDDENLSFALALKKRGLEIREQEGDGNCLFRAVSLQVYGDPSMHLDVRQQCLDFMERDKEHFAQFVTGEPFEQYILRKRQNGVHGNNPEIQAISELFNRPVEVFCPDNGAVPLNIFHAEYKTADAPIRLSYHDGNHYNAVVDPLVPTAGLGLGLPGLQPGLADKMQVARAVTESDAVADQVDFKRALKESEDDELQRAIKESKLSAEHMHSNEALALSDMDATYFELEQAALERSLQSYSNSEHGKKQKASNNRRRKHGRSSPTESCSSEGNDMPSQSMSSLNSNSVASLPVSSLMATEGSFPPAAAAAAAVASVPPPAAAAAKRDFGSSPLLGTVDEYPQTVQELVMNGFPLNKVLHAYEIIGDDFDNLLAFLMANSC